MPATKNVEYANVPLCVDLDGTLIKTDSLLESFILLIKKNPLNLFWCLLWLIKGRAHLKHKIATNVSLDILHLPYSAQFLAFLHQEHARGRNLLLATATDQKIAHQVAEHLGIFSEVLASDGVNNIKGRTKRAVLDQRFGAHQYDYAGNDHADLSVWSSARNAIVVNAKSSLLKKSQKIAKVEHVFLEQKNRFRAFLKAIRPHQFLKNILVFVPLLVGHLYFSPKDLMASILAFVVFCLLAASVYLLNDLLDLNADRQHRTKCKRPFAAGDLPISYGIVMAPLFLVAAMVLSLYLPLYFQLTMLTYYVLTLAYSFYLKRKLLVDVFVLAILYTLRIIAGMAAIGSGYSEWLISFSLFFFLSLAFVKRYSELHFAEQEKKQEIVGRGYQISDLLQLRLFGTVSGYISVLVFALYINSYKVVRLYHYPKLLWLVCLILLYWITRVWMLASRGMIHEDPVVFALEDRISLLAFVAMGVIIVVAMW